MSHTEVDVAEAAYRAKRSGYYVVDVDAAAAARGPFSFWAAAVRECAALNRGRLHATPLEVRLIGPPVPPPFDREPR